ncbi:nucleotidyl transferase AbiEii/AbiGii toxin family protein [Legionella pneumophila]|uniref:nucleotidyl transferase AbiEii/AbiGii toxin family protein n=1 Tax=Legionella pneumophila TaxID=446 RepID=UPI001A18BE7C|nr:nucleotidyl transferase AbiEii/AbiGii toxin family protein [Legionella pneumophila]HAT8863239.1 nucleotidyl transferase AbiEii/AbiGii toxin family protein [Legionella pneumophila subsp. pneumophila]MCZ4689313.1 nucleotidyl transferase AbiEii/AbiGii toxin family protein [Legionella pneumophila]MDW9185310.1 nucleotidyl transferase AbiEii/AbiGii toxin family protein [Legionella pneumophila]HAT2053636.1 nucleotidyl transferase AbiEii/AbiGii toxin family protein [Legionella pneumophila]HAT889281
MTKDISASIRARLKKIAKAEGSKSDFTAVLTRYGLERLLYRIGISKYASQFLLKGALLFNLWYDMPHRPTKDIDLLGVGSNELNYLTSVFKEICSITADDGMVFDEKSVTAETIKKEGGYTGARIELFAELSKARIKIQVDIGYGDAVTPGPIDANYPVLISELPAPKIRIYPVYTVIAEKLHAIALLGMANSRLKDYLDLYVLLSQEQLDNQVLAKAIHATFTRRGMPVPEVLPVGLTDEFANDPSRELMWKAFLKKNELEQRPLVEVISLISTFIQTPMFLAKKAVF